MSRRVVTRVAVDRCTGTGNGASISENGADSVSRDGGGGKG